MLRQFLIVRQKLRDFYYVHVKNDQKNISFKQFQEKDGENLRLDYPLGRDAIVLDVGGYLGDFAADIVCKYGCRVIVFEPVGLYAEKISDRFKFNNSVIVVQAGLGGVEREDYITIAGMESGVFESKPESNSQKEKIKILSIVDYLKAQDYQRIDLLKINIEGGEYELMLSLLEHPELMNKIRFLQIQFHDFITDAVNLRNEIQEKLSETHQMMWEFPFIWESWKVI